MPLIWFIHSDKSPNCISLSIASWYSNFYFTRSWNFISTFYISKKCVLKKFINSTYTLHHSSMLRLSFSLSHCQLWKRNFIAFLLSFSNMRRHQLTKQKKQLNFFGKPTTRTISPQSLSQCCVVVWNFRAAASDSSSMSKFSSWSCNEDSFADYVVFIIFFMPMWCVKPSNRSAIPSYQT